MTSNADRFTGRVADYERYRMRYPASVLDVLRERCGLTAQQVVADVGAGTGMLAELFLANGNPVIAVEPNAEMREACGRLLQRYAGLRVVAASAEETTLPDATVDLVAVGRAFHWFDQARATLEFKRILKPGGWVVLVAARRAQQATERTREYESLLMEHGIDYAKVHTVYRRWETMKPYGEDAASFDITMPDEERLSLEQFLGQTQSLSVTPMPGHAKYDGMQKALREFFAKWSEDGVLRLQTVCSVNGWRTA